jgi:hypothetical protein
MPRISYIISFLRVKKISKHNQKILIDSGSVNWCSLEFSIISIWNKRFKTNLIFSSTNSARMDVRSSSVWYLVVRWLPLLQRFRHEPLGHQLRQILLSHKVTKRNVQKFYKKWECSTEFCLDFYVFCINCVQRFVNFVGWSQILFKLKINVEVTVNMWIMACSTITKTSHICIIKI